MPETQSERKPVTENEEERRLQIAPPLERPSPSIIKLNRFINYLFVLAEGLLGLRILVKVLGGNPGNPVVNFIYSVTDPFVYPFYTAFRWQTIDTGIGVLEIGSILAIGFLILINYATVRLISILVSRG